MRRALWNRKIKHVNLWENVIVLCYPYGFQAMGHRYIDIMDYLTNTHRGRPSIRFFKIEFGNIYVEVIFTASFVVIYYRCEMWKSKCPSRERAYTRFCHFLKLANFCRITKCSAKGIPVALTHDVLYDWIDAWIQVYQTSSYPCHLIQLATRY